MSKLGVKLVSTLRSLIPRCFWARRTERRQERQDRHSRSKSFSGVATPMCARVCDADALMRHRYHTVPAFFCPSSLRCFGIESENPFVQPRAILEREKKSLCMSLFFI